MVLSLDNFNGIVTEYPIQIVVDLIVHDSEVICQVVSIKATTIEQTRINVLYVKSDTIAEACGPTMQNTNAVTSDDNKPYPGVITTIDEVTTLQNLQSDNAVSSHNIEPYADMIKATYKANYLAEVDKELGYRQLFLDVERKRFKITVE